MKPHLKFNNGAGAVLCVSCKVIVHSHFNNVQWKALKDLNVACYCKYCNPEKNKIFEDEYDKKVIEIINENPNEID